MSSSTIEGNVEIDLDASTKSSTCRRSNEVIREEYHKLRNVRIIAWHWQQGKQLNAIINKFLEVK
jgi:hypothetical protein